MQAEQTLVRPSSRRLMLPETEQMTFEASDIEDARKVRYGFSPSYFLNLGSLTGNRYTGYMQIYPRMLYRFEPVFPTGINEDPERVDEKKPEQAPYATVTRQPRTCAEDVRSEAGDRVFAILTALTDREDAQEIWDLIFPIEAEAEIFAMTQRAIRGTVPHYLRSHYEREGLQVPYVKDGHALKAFITHLEKMERELTQVTLSSDVYEAAEATRAEMLQASHEAYQRRYSRLQASFGSMQSRQTSGIGKQKLDTHDEQCIAETGIKRPEDKPVEASQKLGAAMGEAMARKNEESQNQLAQAVTTLAEGQRLMQQQIAQQNEVIMRMLEKQSTS